MNPLHVSASVLTCYEGEQQGGQPNGALPNGDQQPPADSGRTFTQAEMNEVLAKDRRKHQGQLQKMEATLSTLAESKSLSEEDRARTEAQLEEVRTAVLTKDQQVQREKKALEERARQETQREGAGSETLGVPLPGLHDRAFVG